jgi:hypothetical protein
MQRHCNAPGTLRYWRASPYEGLVAVDVGAAKGALDALVRLHKAGAMQRQRGGCVGERVAAGHRSRRHTRQARVVGKAGVRNACDSSGLPFLRLLMCAPAHPSANHITRPLLRPPKRPHR